MLPGRGKGKGSGWERDVGKQLSLWLTNSARPDIFSRNVLSGGAFTVAAKAGKLSSRMPGDLMAAHPLAFQFLSQYLIECKHLASLGLENYLFDTSGKAQMTGIVALATKQAIQAELEYMIIAKQNHREPLVLVAGYIGQRMLLAHGRSSSRTIITPNHHYLHKQRIFLMRFRDMLSFVKPTSFLEHASG
jgi:hypothetical protein